VLGKARQHLQGFLLRHGRVYAGKKGWTLPYRRWLTTLRFDHPAQQVVLQDYIHSVHDAEERIARLTKQIEERCHTNLNRRGAGFGRPAELQAAVAACHVRNAWSLRTRSVRRDVR
jgi:hypothetical protein